MASAAARGSAPQVGTGVAGLKERLLELGLDVKVRLSVVSAHWLHDGEQRLDAGFYSDERLSAERLVRDSGLPVQTAGQLSEEVFAAPISSRHFSPHGVPYLVPSDVYCFRPTADKFVIESKLKSPERWRVKKSWVLVTQSGSVGRTCLATERLEHFVVSQNLLRAVPKEGVREGYLCAFLSSWVGQALLAKDRYGGAIKHLEPYHVANVPVPMLPDSEQEEIHRDVVEAYALRDEANRQLDLADELLHSELGLARFSPEDAEYLTPPSEGKSSLMPPIRAFSVRASDLANRLDGSYHTPVAQAAVARLKAARFGAVPLGDVVERVFIPPRFTRIYVPSEFGVPLLQGSHLPALKPYDLKYISRAHTKRLDRWLLKPGWVLVTCSGTIGQIGLTTSTLDGWAASQHILRIVPNLSKAHPGFLTAFLTTPYGYHQLRSKVYGGVVDELTEADTEAVVVPDAPEEIQNQIGSLVAEAYEMKDRASALEEGAISRLVSILQDLTAAI